MFLLGVNLPDSKRVDISLTYIFGIGRTTGEKLCHQLEIHPQCRLKDLSEGKITKLSQLLNTLTIEAELKRETQNNIKTLVDIGTYRGNRHKIGRPIKGRTRTNGHTAIMLNGKFLKRAFSTLRTII